MSAKSDALDAIVRMLSEAAVEEHITSSVPLRQSELPRPMRQPLLRRPITGRATGSEDDEPDTVTPNGGEHEDDR